MLLRFEDGPLDGFEEESPSTPVMLRRQRLPSKTIHLADTAEERDATYELRLIDYLAGVAHYALVED